jgi:hypothetical protein
MSDKLTTAQTLNETAFAGEWVYDPASRSIMRDDNPALTLDPVVFATPKNTERVGVQTATFCHHAHRLYIDDQRPVNRPPQMFLTVTESELSQGAGETIITVQVIGPDGKTARVHLTLGHSDAKGELWAEMNAPSRNKDHTKSLTMKYADWTK